MAKVILANNWFAPLQGKFGGQRFRKDPDGNPVDIPNRLLKYLPKSAKIVADNYVLPHVVAEKQQELKDLDTFRAMDDESAKILAAAGVLDANYNPFEGKEAPEAEEDDSAEEAVISQRAQDAETARKKRAEFRKAQEAERNANK